MQLRRLGTFHGNLVAYEVCYIIYCISTEAKYILPYAEIQIATKPMYYVPQKKPLRKIRNAYWQVLHKSLMAMCFEMPYPNTASMHYSVPLP